MEQVCTPETAVWSGPSRPLGAGLGSAAGLSSAVRRLGSVATGWWRPVRELGPWALAVAVAVVVGVLLGAPGHAGTTAPPALSPYEPIAPAAGIAAWWLTRLARRGRWWATPSVRAAVATLVVVSAAVLVGFGADPRYAALRGVGLAAQALVTAAAWTRLALPAPQGGAGSVGLLARQLVACAVGALADVPFAAVLPVGRPDGALDLLAWAIRGAAAAYGVAVLGQALGEAPAPDRALARPAWGARLAVAVATSAAAAVAAYVGSGSGPRLYLLVPVTLWAAATFTVRGVALHTCALLALAIWDGPTAFGATPAERTLTINSFALVVVGVGMTVVRDRQERAALLRGLARRAAQDRDQAKLLSGVLASAEDALVTTGPGGEVLLANAAATGLARRAGLTLPDLLAQVPDGAEASPVAAVLSGAGATTADVRLSRDPDRPGLVVAVRAYPMAHDEGTGAVVWLQDVTQERLRTEGLRYFARAVAHDLRNPLAGIALSSELAVTALDEGDTDEAQAAVASILRSGDRASAMLAEISAFSLASDGELATEALYLDDFVAAVAGQRATDAGAPPLDLRIDADVCVDADPRLLARLFDNLLGNAAKYCVAGALPKVDVVAYEAGHDRVCVLVQDRGIGLPEGQERLVFDAFHRVPEHAGRYPGTGLGLAICRQVVQRHGGEISAERRRGGGTTFRFTLPVAAERPLVPAPTEWGTDESEDAAVGEWPWSCVELAGSRA